MKKGSNTFEGALSWLSDVTQKLFDEKRELAAAEAASAASPHLNCSAKDSLEITLKDPPLSLIDAAINNDSSIVIETKDKNSFKYGPSYSIIY